LLRYVEEQAIHGRAAQLKERVRALKFSGVIRITTPGWIRQSATPHAKFASAFRNIIWSPATKPKSASNFPAGLLCAGVFVPHFVCTEETPDVASGPWSLQPPLVASFECHGAILESLWSPGDWVGGDPNPQQGPGAPPTALDVTRNDRIAYSDGPGLLGQNKKTGGFACDS
jgi:hypothetical protein